MNLEARMKLEALASRDGLSLCQQHHIQVQHIEMDSKGLLDMNQVNCSSTWKLYYIITDCKPTISSQINVAQSYREGNQVADSMAAYGHQVHSLTVLNDHTQLSGLCKPVLYGQAVICL